MEIVKDLTEAVGRLQTRVTPKMKSAKSYADGDHWQKGDGFLPFAFMDSADQAAKKEKIEKAFSSEDVVSKVVTNETNLFLGREPDWQPIPEKDTEDVSEQVAALLEYWNERDMLKLLKEAEALTCSHGRAIVRAFIPSGLRNSRGAIPRQKDFISAMRVWRFEVLEADKAGVFYEKNTYQKFGVFRTRRDETDITETTKTIGGKTVVSVTENTNNAALASETLPSLQTFGYMPKDRQIKEEFKPLDLDGEILYFEIERPPLITESVMSLQRAVNFNHSTQDKNTYRHGNRAFVALNAEQPEEDTGETDGEGRPIKIKTSIKLDGSGANFLQGVPVEDENNLDKDGLPAIIGYANPGFQTIEPSDPKVFIDSVNSKIEAIYRICQQEHLLTANLDNVSGKSKEESRAAFEKHGKNLAATFNALGRWMLKILVFGAAEIQNERAKYDGWRFDFNCIVDAGAASPEMIAQAQTAVTEGNLSRETFLSKYLGMEDADAEIKRLDESPQSQSNEWNRKIELAQKAKEFGFEVSFITSEILKITDAKERSAFEAAIAAFEEKQARELENQQNMGFAN